MKMQFVNREPSARDQGGEAPEEAVETLDEGTDPASMTPEEIEGLKTDAAKGREHYQMLLRTAADFENYKKRVTRETQDLRKYATEPLLSNLISVLDNFEMALAAAQGAQDASVQSFQTGLNMILQQFKKTLTDAGLQEIDATNKPFDPNIHEAVSQRESSDVPEGHVLQQLRKGYKLHDRLLRPAGVIVAKRPGQ